jgi:hypothetical protein
MLLPSLIQRVELLVGIDTPTVPLSCAWAKGVVIVKPTARLAANTFNVVLRAFKV